MAGNKLPVIGPWAAQLTRIKQFAMVSCTPDPIAMIYGQAIAGFNIVWSIVAPECVDTAWDRLHPRKGNKRSLSMRANSFSSPITATEGSMTSTMIKIGDAAQKLGFYFSLIDSTLKGVVYGTSLVFRYSGCAVPGAPFAQLSMKDTLPVLFPAGDFLINTWKVDDQYIIGGGPVGIHVPQNVSDEITVVCYMTQKKKAFPGLPDAKYSIRVVDLQTNTTLPRSFSPFVNNDGNAYGAYSQDYFIAKKGRDLGVYVTKTEGVFMVDDARFIVQGVKYKLPIQVWKCGAKIEFNA